MRTVTGPWGTFRAWDRDIVGHTISTGVFWDQQIQPFLDEADPTGWAIDLGANIGWFTVYLAKRGHPCVVAVEAHPATCDLLRHNVAANGVAQAVQVVYGAAYDHDCTLQLADESWLGWPVPSALDLDQTSGSASIAFIPRTEATPARLVVPAFPIDGLIAGWQAPFVSVIKVDCQGADLRALVGLSQTIDRDRPIIVFEVEGCAIPWFGDTWADYEAFFAQHQYSLTRIREDLGDYVARPL